MKTPIVFRRDNPVLKNHRAYGQELMPGLTYIDIILQFFQGQGHDPLALGLRNLALYRPLIVGATGPLEASIEATETAFGWRVAITDGSGQAFVTADAVTGEPVEFKERIDPSKAARGTIPIEEIYARCRAAGMAHKGFMKAEGTLLPGEDAFIASIEIPDCARALADQFLFHPTLLDGGSLATGMVFSDSVDAETRLFLPLSVGSFRWSGPLRDRCYARVRRETARRQGSMLFRDLEFFNAAGEKVAELGNFVCTLVRDSAHLRAPGSGAEPQQATDVRVAAWLRQLLAEQLKVPAGEIPEDAGFYEIGMDSAMLLAVADAVGRRLGQSLPPTLLFEFSNLRALTDHLMSAGAGMLLATEQPAPAAPSPRPAAEAAIVSALAEPVAIIGLAGRYPGAADLAAFWRNLCAGTDSVTEIPASRWDTGAYAHLQSRTGRPISRWGGFIDAPDAFDARFFRISPREAELMDPQERKFLEVCWEAMEDAGYTPETIAPTHGPGKRRHVGVFAGVMHKDYTLVVAEALHRPDPLPLSLNYAQIANRVSFFCGFHGPSLVVDTVCSSSLVAVHLAVESLRRGECDVCLAGGVNLSLHPAKYITYGQGNLFSTDGRCRAFGEGGDGYVPAEGVGAVLLKPLRQAIEDKDPIYAVIRGSAVNHVGHVSGVTVPSAAAQADLVVQALEQAGIGARSIDYVEAHGTGTSLGDPIEIEGLTKAFRTGTGDLQFCAIGSVKSNIGHAEAAAGISGLTKLALQLHYRTLVPSLHAERTNPHIDFAASPFFVQRELAAWPACGDGRPGRGSVSSFGATGTNAHIVLEGFVAPPRATTSEDPVILPLSAQTDERLRAYALRVAGFLEANPHTLLADIAYTFQVGRKAFDRRAIFPARDRAELAASLVAFGKAGDPPAIEGDAAAFAKAWLDGKPCDWLSLYHGRPVPRRSHAPAYPFATDRYWAPMGQAADTEVLLAARQPIGVAAGAAPAMAPKVLIPVTGRTAFPPWLEEELARESLHRLEVASDAFEDLAAALFRAIKERDGGLPRRQRWQIVLDAAIGAGVADSLAGLCLTAEQEIPSLSVQLVELETADFATADRFGQALRDAGSLPGQAVLRHREGSLSASIWHEVANVSAPPRWKDHGVYLVTGGAGGLGMLFARDIAASVRAPRIVLAGRSVLDPTRQAALDALRAAGAQVRYERADIADRASVAGLVQGVVKENGGLDGVIHSAGVLSDGLIRNQTEAAFREVLAPKVAGTRLLDELTADLDLDFFVLFSSGAGVFGNPGQAGYAAANAFQGAFARARQEQVIAGKRRGRTLAIHWPLWADGGMRPSEAVTRLWDEKVGLRPLPTQAGLDAFHRAMATGEPEILVLAGQADRLRRHFGIGGAAAAALPRETAAASPSPESEPAADDVRQAVLAHVKRLLGEITKVPVGAIRTDDKLENFGLDSVMVVQFGQGLAGLSPDIPQTLLYEFSDLRTLARHLVDRYPAECAGWSALRPAAPAIPQRRDNQTAVPVAVAPRLPDAPGRVEPIAIIGIAGRYPRSPDLNTLWDNLLSGRDCVGEIPAERWPLHDFYEADRRVAVESGRSYSKWGGFLEGFADFDPLFFQISPKEAAAIDPQERLFIETAWQAFEDAGYSRDEIQRRHEGRVGVFAGITRTGFNLYALDRWKAGDTMLPATSFSSVANRVSYLMNLHGPSMPIDTMCSSSLTAIHEACEHLRRGDCDMALAGGVNLYLHPLTYVAASAQQMLSPDGRCKSFGAGANGFVPGEGVGAVLLKPLRAAERDGDQIHAVIRASAINHNGKTNGYTVPNPRAQRDLIKAVIEKAGIDADTVTLIEAHGTGTELGDPIEIQGLQEALETRDGTRPRCAVSSVKSNIGHLEAAAGIAGVTKVILQMRHRMIAPSLHARELNPKIDFARSALYVPREARDWSATGTLDRPVPRRAGVSSFGAGGANAHVLLEEYLPASAPPASAEGPVLIVLSARTEAALLAQAAALLARIDAEPPALRDAAFTLQVGREAFPERLAIVTPSGAHLKQALQAFIDGRPNEDTTHRGDVRDAPAVFDMMHDDPDMEALIGGWARQGRLSKIAAFWVKGFPIDWRHLYLDPPPRRISLPTAHFERQRFWIEQQPVATPAAPAESAGLLFKSVWHRLPDALPPNRERPGSTVILYARSSQSLADALAAFLPRARIVPLSRNFAAVRQVLRSGQGIDRIMILADAPDAAEPQPIEAILLDLLKDLRREGFGLDVPEFVLVTQNATDGGHGAGLHGLGLALAQNGLRLVCCDIDAAELRTATACAGVLDLVSRLTLDPRGDVVRIRHAACFRRSLQSLRLTDTGGGPAIRKGGRYVIVGGTGRIGQIVSRHLIREHAAHPIWIGRSAADAPEVRGKLEAFAADGLAPLYLQADATDPASLRAAASRMGGAAGVIFAAMDFAFGDPFAVAAADFDRVLDIKQSGAWNVFEAFKDQPLDFLCYFSSTQAYGFSDARNSAAYAAGISAGDAAARRAAAAAPFPVGIIHWGFWRAAIAGTILERNSGALENVEGLACLETSISLLRQGRLADVTCMRLPSGSARTAIPILDGVVEAAASDGRAAAGGTLPDSPPVSAGGLVDGAAQARFADRAKQVLLVTLRRMGCFSEADPTSIGTMLTRAGIVPAYRRWLQEALDLLASAALIEATAAGYVELRAGRECDTEAVLSAWSGIRAEAEGDQMLQPMVALLARCLANLPAILRKEVPATDLIFPAGDTAALGSVYEGNAWSDFFNSRLAEAVVAIVERSLREDPGRVVRIIEVGAGTGGTTRTVLSYIHDYGAKLLYLYTDLSTAFLRHGRNAFAAAYPFVRFQRWNVDHPPAADEIEEGSYDVIIATNVLHATGDIRRTLRNVKAALRPGGVLLLNETIFKTLFGTLTFGLLDGWWAFDDGHLRISGSPLLAPGQWACLLEEEGFRETRFLTEPLEAAAQLVIAAESDGWIHRGIEPAIARALLPAPRSRKVAVTAAPEDHLDHVQAIVVNAVASSLSIELGRIDQRVPFSDYGVDSIVGTQLVALIRKDLGIDINASVLYEHTSVERLVRHLRGVIPGRTAIGPVAAIVKDLDAAPFDALEAAFLSGELSPDDVLELLENTPSGGGVGQ